MVPSTWKRWFQRFTKPWERRKAPRVSTSRASLQNPGVREVHRPKRDQAEKKQERGNYGANNTLRTRFRKINRLGNPAHRLWVLGDCAAVRDFLGVVLVIAWLIVFSGGFQFIHAFQSKGIGSIVWKLLVAVLYLIVGLYFLMNPLLGVAAFTFALAIFFVAEGLVDLVAYFQNRSAIGSGWILFDGIVTLILGLMVCGNGRRVHCG